MSYENPVGISRSFRGGSSEGYWAMGASLTQRRRVEDDGLRLVNSFSRGRDKDGTRGISLG